MSLHNVQAADSVCVCVLYMCVCVCTGVIPRLMICKTVQATPQAGHSAVLESSSSSQGAAGLNGATRREMEVNGSAAGNKMVDSNELERLFTQPKTQDTCMVREERFERKEKIHLNPDTVEM